MVLGKRADWRASAQTAERGAGRVKSRHAMHSPTRRRRRGAEEDRRVRGRIRVEDPQARPGEELAEVEPAAADVAPDVIRVIGLELGRAHRADREDPVPETRREPLDLT